MKSITRQVADSSDMLIRYEKTAQIVAHWASLSDADGVGDIPAFDPVSVPRLLPFIYLLQRSGDRLRYRVSGEEVNRLFGSSHTGRYLDEVVPPEIYPDVAPFFFSVLEGNVGIFKGHVRVPGRQHMEFERVLLPIRRKGEIQLLGTLAMSTTSELRRDRPPPPAAGPGFHFHLLNLDGGPPVSRHRDLFPVADRYCVTKRFVR